MGLTSRDQEVDHRLLALKDSLLTSKPQAITQAIQDERMEIICLQSQAKLGIPPGTKQPMPRLPPGG